MTVPQEKRQAGLVAVVLAGGRARRMGGGDKCLLPVGGLPILDRILAVLRPQAERVAISANGPPGRFAGHGCPVLPDPPAWQGAGPLAGLAAALAAFPARPVLTVPGDTPFLPADLADRLLAAAGDGAAHACSAGRDHPAVALYPPGVETCLSDYLAGGGRSVHGFLSRLGSRAVAWEGGAEDDPFANVNDAAGLAAARRRAG